MNIMLLRKTATMASRQARASLPFFESIHHRLFHFSSTEEGIVPANDAQLRSFSRNPTSMGLGLGYIGARVFHAGPGPLELRAAAPPAEYAVADDNDEERSNSGSNDGLEISKLGISQHIVSALAKKGITKLFPIQRAVLEPAMQGRDMIGRARTGTGKTLAFGIPILDKIIQYNSNSQNRRGRNPLALVLAPTRELARQVDKEFYESAPNLITICVYGGTPISRQINELDYGVDVVVGTPGRIIDLLKRGALNLSEVQFVVLDEADQMLNVGFEEDVEVILEKLPRNRQSLMFSATMPTWIRRISMKYLKDPLTIDLVGDSDQKLPEGITLYSVASDMYRRASIIGPLITEHAKGGKCIVFTQTKRDADRLAYTMARNFACEALHGDISQNQRERTLHGFREGRFNILVATDVAARGLDVPNVDLVIHYELPNSSEIFVHRSGRTGRAGKKGNAILIYTDEQTRTVRNIERDVGCKFTELPRIAVEGGARETFDDFGGGGGRRFGSYGSRENNRFGDSSFTRYSGSGGSGGSGFSRSGGYGGSGYGRSGGYGSSSPRRSDGYGESGSNRYGSFGGSSGRSGGGFGGSSSSRSNGFGGPSFGRSSGFGDLRSSERLSGFGALGSGRSSGFGDSRSSQTIGSDGSRSSRFDSFRDIKVDSDQEETGKFF